MVMDPKVSPGDMVRIKAEIRSTSEPGHIFCAGSEARVVLMLGENAMLAEFRVYDPRLEGDAWYETVELHVNEVERVSSAAP